MSDHGNDDDKNDAELEDNNFEDNYNGRLQGRESLFQDSLVRHMLKSERAEKQGLWYFYFKPNGTNPKQSPEGTAPFQTVKMICVCETGYGVI